MEHLSRGTRKPITYIVILMKSSRRVRAGVVKRAALHCGVRKLAQQFMLKIQLDKKNISDEKFLKQTISAVLLSSAPSFFQNITFISHTSKILFHTGFCKLFEFKLVP